MRASRWTFQIVDGSTVTGPVHGAGGLVGEAGLYRLQVAVRRAKAGLPLALYEPSPGHVRVYPDYSSAGDREPVDIDLRRVTAVTPVVAP